MGEDDVECLKLSIEEQRITIERLRLELSVATELVEVLAERSRERIADLKGMIREAAGRNAAASPGVQGGEIVIWRLWCYFRTGYGLYLGAAVSVVTMATSVFYLCLAHVPTTARLGFLGFCLALAILGLPACCVIGWLHYRTAYKADATISIDMNPYLYIAVPGKERNVIFPWMLAVLQAVADRRYPALESELERLAAGKDIRP